MAAQTPSKFLRYQKRGDAKIGIVGYAEVFGNYTA